MKAITYTEFGGPEVLRLEEVDEPHAGPGQVRLKVVAAGVNPLDSKIRNGWRPQVAPPRLVRGAQTVPSNHWNQTGDGWSLERRTLNAMMRVGSLIGLGPELALHPGPVKASTRSHSWPAWKIPAGC